MDAARTLISLLKFSFRLSSRMLDKEVPNAMLNERFNHTNNENSYGEFFPKHTIYLEFLSSVNVVDRSRNRIRQNPDSNTVSSFSECCEQK